MFACVERFPDDGVIEVELNEKSFYYFFDIDYKVNVANRPSVVVKPLLEDIEYIKTSVTFSWEYKDEWGFVIEKEKCSIGMLQRVFKIGFNRAARIMDQLEEAGVVGPEEGTKPRRILMSMNEFENYLQER